MTSIGEWGTFTLDEAGGMAEVLRAVEGNRAVMWQTPNHGLWRGQATHIVDRDGNMPDRLADVRDLYVYVRPHTPETRGRWHVAALIRAYSEGTFAIFIGE